MDELGVRAGMGGLPGTEPQLDLEGVRLGPERAEQRDLHGRVVEAGADAVVTLEHRDQA